MRDTSAFLVRKSVKNFFHLLIKLELTTYRGWNADKLIRRHRSQYATIDDMFYDTY